MRMPAHNYVKSSRSGIEVKLMNIMKHVDDCRPRFSDRSCWQGCRPSPLVDVPSYDYDGCQSF